MNSAIRRIVKDIKIIEKNNLTEQGIYCSWDESNLYNVKILIVGNHNTPYEKCFFTFDINFPTTYPFDPPKVEFLTKYRNFRFHPNLYSNGKVCLSVLNTWHGPKWSPCNNLQTVLIILKSLFTKYPIEYEPGYENNTNSQLSKAYNNLIKYFCYEGIILKILTNFKQKLKYFDLIIHQKVNEYYNWYLKDLDKLTKKYNLILKINIPIYNINIKISYSDLKKKLKKIDYR